MGVVGIELCRRDREGLLVEGQLAEAMKTRYRRRPVEVWMMKTDWTVTVARNAKMTGESSSMGGKKRKLVVKYEEALEEEESGDDLLVVNLSPRKPNDLIRPYYIRTHEYVTWH